MTAQRADGTRPRRGFFGWMPYRSRFAQVGEPVHVVALGIGLNALSSPGTEARVDVLDRPYPQLQPGVAMTQDARRYTAIRLAGAAAACVTVLAAASPAAAVSSGAWGNALEIPGITTLNQGGTAQVTSVSCPSAGNCSAGGFYKDSSYRQQAFVVSEVNGTWQAAIEVPGSATLNSGGGAEVFSVSCASAGNCSAGGDYFSSSSGGQAFITSEVNGTWRKAIEVPGTATLNSGGGAQVTAVSCASAGNCSAGGQYEASHGNGEAFVADEVNSTWRKARKVPGTATLNSAGPRRSRRCRAPRRATAAQADNTRPATEMGRRPSPTR